MATLELIRGHNLQGCICLGNDTTDIDAFGAIHAASLNSNFQGFAIGIIIQKTPEKLIAEADFTLNGVNDVECFLRWTFQTVLQPG